MSSKTRRAVKAAAASGLLALSTVVPGAQAARADSSITISVGPIFTELPAPLSTSQCQAAYGIRCYTPVQLHNAYNLAPLYARGITGKGRTIVIAVPFGSPVIQHDLSVFSAQFGLPAPDVRTVQFGDIPPYDPTDFTRIEWAAATTVQAEYAHAAAPDAKIVIAATNVSETEGLTGLPELMNAEKAMADQGVGDVFLQIFGAAEGTFPGVEQGDDSSLLNLRYAYKDAAAHHVTVVSAAGDTGVTESEADGSTLYPHPAVNWPASDPLVTAVGGTQLFLDNAGNRLQPDVAWNDYGGAGAGGLSEVFNRPWYQADVAGVAGSHRALPDISMAAAVDGGSWVYTSFDGIGGSGWSIFDGTIVAAPFFSGIVALADQQAGHRLGPINPALYALGALSQHGFRHTGLVDVTVGDNSLGGVTGFTAGPGYDLTSGWGTVNAASFVPALAHLG
jgi:subtilase family serine protease